MVIGTTKKPTPEKLCIVVEGTEVNALDARDLIGIDKRQDLMFMSSKVRRDTLIDIYDYVLHLILLLNILSFFKCIRIEFFYYY